MNRYQDRTFSVLFETRARIASPLSWVQGSGGDGMSRFCLGTSMQRTILSQNHGADYSAMYLVAGMINRVCPEAVCTGTSVIPEWNDSRSTKHEDVLALLDLCIEERINQIENRGEIAVRPRREIIDVWGKVFTEESLKADFLDMKAFNATVDKLVTMPKLLMPKPVYLYGIFKDEKVTVCA
jgi:hypothetical protein